MRKYIVAARGVVQKFRPSALQFAGGAGVSWGLWDVAPWAGKAAAGLLLVAFGVAAERGA
jgi:hypothetical protein